MGARKSFINKEMIEEEFKNYDAEKIFQIYQELEKEIILSIKRKHKTLTTATNKLYDSAEYF